MASFSYATSILAYREASWAVAASAWVLAASLTRPARAWAHLASYCNTRKHILTQDLTKHPTSTTKIEVSRYKDRVRCLLEVINVAAVVCDASLKSATSRRSVMTSSSHGVPTYKHQLLSSSTLAPPPPKLAALASAAGQPCKGRPAPLRRVEQRWSHPSMPWMPLSLRPWWPSSSHPSLRLSETAPPAPLALCTRMPIGHYWCFLMWPGPYCTQAATLTVRNSIKIDVQNKNGCRYRGLLGRRP
jgi:hypothetical protein